MSSENFKKYKNVIKVTQGRYNIVCYKLYL